MSINPDEVVAYGATLEVALLTDDIKFILDLVMRDIIPLSLGIMVKRDVINVLIPRNSTIPIKKKQVYHTREDDHPEASTDVFMKFKLFMHNFKELFYCLV